MAKLQDPKINTRMLGEAALMASKAIKMLSNLIHDFQRVAKVQEDYKKEKAAQQDAELRRSQMRKLLVMRNQGRTYKDIGRELSMNPHYVGQLCRRAIKELSIRTRKAA